MGSTWSIELKWWNKTKIKTIEFWSLDKNNEILKSTKIEAHGEFNAFSIEGVKIGGGGLMEIFGNLWGSINFWNQGNKNYIRISYKYES